MLDIFTVLICLIIVSIISLITIPSLITNRCIFPMEFCAGYKYRRVLKKNIKEKWIIEKISYFTGERLNDGWWSFYTSVKKREDAELGDPDWTNGFIKFNTKTGWIIDNFIGHRVLKTSGGL